MTLPVTRYPVVRPNCPAGSETAPRTAKHSERIQRTDRGAITTESQERLAVRKPAVSEDACFASGHRSPTLRLSELSKFAVSVVLAVRLIRGRKRGQGSSTTRGN